MRRLGRYRYGPGVFKLDWALSGPIPWREPRCLEASTVHLGGTMDELAAGEAAVWRGEHPDKPFVLVVQQSQFDATRAPAGKHTGYAYCHVPAGSTVDLTDVVERQVERFAPGFRDVILGAAPDAHGGAGAPQPELLRRRNHRRRLEYLPGVRAPGIVHGPLRDAQSPDLHLLRLDAARRWRARNVRGSRGRQRRTAACEAADPPALNEQQPDRQAEPAPSP